MDAGITPTSEVYDLRAQSIHCACRGKFPYAGLQESPLRSAGTFRRIITLVWELFWDMLQRVVLMIGVVIGVMTISVGLVIGIMTIQ